MLRVFVARAAGRPAPPQSVPPPLPFGAFPAVGAFPLTASGKRKARAEPGRWDAGQGSVNGRREFVIAPGRGLCGHLEGAVLGSGPPGG